MKPRALAILAACAGVAGPPVAERSAADPPPGRAWKQVFQDEFDGPALDASKWARRTRDPAFAWNGAKGRLCDDHADVDGRGHFVVRVSRDADGTYRYHHGIETKGRFQRVYGYFETRVRFTSQPGWWGSVWLRGVDHGPNPFLRGQEIDLFEDFFKPKTKNEFAQNVHMDAQLGYFTEDQRKIGKMDGDRMYRVSNGRHDVPVDDWNAFHTIGVEWTPLEYVFHCDGRETWRIDHRQMPVTTQPMFILISGCFRDPARAKFQGDYADGTWPDQLTVDYVRVYEEDPGARQPPQVRLTCPAAGGPVAASDRLTFRIETEDSDGPVTNLYLFTNGRVRAESPGASATIALQAAQLYAGTNILIAMARDADGLIGRSEPLSLVVGEPGKGQP